MKALLAVALTLAVAALVVIAVRSPGPAAGSGEEDEPPVETAVTTVVRTDLVQTQTLEGELRFSDPSRLIAQVPGIVTEVPSEGAVVAIDDSAYELDGADVVVLEGARPAWRTFHLGMSEGHDVLQLESNLERLGHVDSGFSPDQEFDEATENAIESWQESIGREATGVIPFGSVVFSEGPFRVGEVAVIPSAPVAPGTTVYVISSLSQEVLIELDPRDLDLVSEGDPVNVILPDGAEIPGEIAEVGRVVRRSGPEPDAPDLIDVIVAISGIDLDLERAPVEVEVESDRAQEVLAVPVRSLVSLSDGGYAVEVDDGGERRLVGVTIGDFAEGLVEVEGAISEGDSVVVPVG